MAMNFWSRHPGLEKLSLSAGDEVWFCDNVESGLFPRLTHLKATYNNVRTLASYLGQLQHLSITNSQNCQVPYLLRSVISAGLPRLKSLEINQNPTSDLILDESTRWYEKANGRVTADARQRELIQKMPIGYIHSIVRGAPNIEELCLQGPTIFPSHFKPIRHHIAQFTCLERVYFRAFRPRLGKLQKGDIDGFLSACWTIATSCRTVKVITDISTMEFGQYLTGKVIRDSQGSVIEVVPSRGFGMEFTGGDEDAFPHNLLCL